MTMDDFEPACGCNLPPGCMDVPDEPDARACGRCRRYVEVADALGACGPELDEAEARGDLGRPVSARLVCAWLADNAVGEGDDAAETCPGYGEEA